MKTLLLLFALIALTAFGQLDVADTPFAAATPAPASPPQIVFVQAPQPLTPESFTSKALAWITAVSVVLSAVAAAVWTLWGKVKDMMARQDRQAQKTGQLQGQMVDLAKAVPPPGPADPSESPK